MSTTSGEVCSMIVENVINIIGGKWAFLVIAHLNDGPLRFNQLKRNISAISTQSLTVNLRNLEQNGMVLRKVFPTVPTTVEYSLTEKGKDFIRVLEEMYNWGKKWEVNFNQMF
ncbi:DNA-binding HxlR family transcriptional regulator [Anaerosolibacter carboniphilus]|uniref:DNA-binding HxlR family transcriptional regulator n=1 Tax=Anaerosolibacter carboniphilus TaxID=1417629 RepID=A0A841KVL0_9FIRM|nr:helix-turn-helix domain-containing protein [Anaerosolibacter carboniphilus]MBB6214229.1 DNA-binding HxlR family transcriptional regulator [Anaerosolibacter carboniphilus]